MRSLHGSARRFRRSLHERGNALTTLDIVLGVLLLLAAIVGAYKGLVRQLGGIFAILLGVILAFRYGTRLADLAAPYLRSDQLRNVLGPVAVFLVVYLGVILITSILHKAIHGIHMGWMNRMAGAFFCSLAAAIPAGALLLLLVGYVPNVRPVVASSPVACQMMDLSGIFLRLIPENAKGVIASGKEDLKVLIEKYKRSRKGQKPELTLAP